MSNIRKKCSDAEVLWGSYSNDVCHEIYDFIKDEGIYDNRNFYEFCKGSVFTAIHLEQQNKQLREEIKKLKFMCDNLLDA